MSLSVDSDSIETLWRAAPNVNCRLESAAAPRLRREKTWDVPMPRALRADGPASLGNCIAGTRFASSTVRGTSRACVAPAHMTATAGARAAAEAPPRLCYHDLFELGRGAAIS